MTYSISADHEKHLIYVKYKGDITIAERKAAVVDGAALLDDLKFTNVIVDLCDANMAPDSLEEQDKFATILSNHPVLSKCKVVYFSNTELSDNFFIETMARVRHITCTHFTDLDQAYEWLEQTEEA